LSKLFDVSRYLDFPFTLEEAASYFLPRSNLTAAQLGSILVRPEFEDLKFTVKDGYLLTSDEQSIPYRFEREHVSAAKLESAASFASLLTRLVPFIRTVAVTGSVAYGSADKWDDVDLFVITQRNRLWISTFLMLLQIRLYKILGLRAAHLLPFCLSYLHDEDGFSKESRRSRTNPLFARELLKAKPIAGTETYRRILEENKWVGEFYSAPYRQKLRLLETELDGASPSTGVESGFLSLLLVWIEGFTYTVLSRYLRLRAYLTNLRLKSEGNHIRAFEPNISPASCIYTSNFYRWLSALWGAQ
jgi:predicted nucleotidyltransferase